ncbi:guanyl-specific ribonuclease F1 [Colletotrichum graminicola]|uniref:ribonuclease T1 n=1 Tax=Colletotrichum graminicola (strain M1.001 / M2 / FGSC 10212) TaxID=645133 RepID=E3QDQ2_COLGM|nr:guanyl-specific ribonuclease F1 [Colletotrichum graminicola M1.001]EFQ28989.1 guanyl-specific ribonuclease F1 [Colletotrichum graminicola M1.001]WDK20044.1 guanyl-specific ribonuclease F1 [Colletotrichum graminicola]
MIQKAAVVNLPVMRCKTCGANVYSLLSVRSAADAACKHVEAGTTAGSSSYPQTYRNQEGFDFNGVTGPFVEFPMKTNGVYKGGK